MVEQGDIPSRYAGWNRADIRCYRRCASDIVKSAPRQSANARRKSIVAPNDDRVISGYDVIACAAIDHIVSASIKIVGSPGNVLAADQIVIPGVTVQLIVALLAKYRIIPLVTVDNIVSPSFRGPGEDCCHTS